MPKITKTTKKTQLFCKKIGKIGHFFEFNFSFGIDKATFWLYHYIDSFIMVWVWACNYKNTDKLIKKLIFMGNLVYKFFKRFFDILGALVLIILLSPTLIITAFLVKVTSKGPIIFKQDRLGKNGKVYKMWKFRSMCVGAEKMEGGVYCEKGDKRVTKVGAFIRKTSIDELPQLWNILKGDMSFIGFRSPLTYHPWEFSEYTDEQKKMFLVRPGLTGYTQVSGRKTIEWHKRIELNVYYAEHISFWLDMKIFFKTFFVVFSAKDNENKGKTLEESCEGNQ